MEKKTKNNIAILLAAGSGLRFDSNKPKQYTKLSGGQTPFIKAIETFLENPLVDYVLPVFAENHEHMFLNELQLFCKYKQTILPYCIGGKQRKDSVLMALKHVESLHINTDKVLIHDVARCFISQDIIKNVLLNIESGVGVVPGLSVPDTLKKVDNDGFIYDDVPRENIFKMQTPQGFIFKEILNAHENFIDHTLTDDASYYIKNGGKVKVIKGNVLNSKITVKEDLDMLNKLNSNPITLVGMGIDVHEFSNEQSDNKDLYLCGVKIPYHKGLKGHSDADVGLHALVDAILGALGKGDIGDFFPPSDQKWKGAPSKIFLEFVKKALDEENVVINNIDICILAEEPKIAPYKNLMKENIATILGIQQSQINIKATTTEKLGFVGRKEGIVAQAIFAGHKS
jgi:2-C-methyl-D-erythritol 4-phosphate cytidylyltransferase/2-C-methyl-D-erythritol 2,4-cyclodiphosphate synthase